MVSHFLVLLMMPVGNHCEIVDDISNNYSIYECSDHSSAYDAEYWQAGLTHCVSRLDKSLVNCLFTRLLSSRQTQCVGLAHQYPAS